MTQPRDPYGPDDVPYVPGPPQPPYKPPTGPYPQLTQRIADYRQSTPGCPYLPPPWPPAPPAVSPTPKPPAITAGGWIAIGVGALAVVVMLVVAIANAGTRLPDQSRNNNRLYDPPTPSDTQTTLAVTTSPAPPTTQAAPNPPPPAPPTAQAAPTTQAPSRARIGEPFRVVLKSGASADVLIASVKYQPMPGHTMNQYAIVDVEITGQSAQPFPYNESNFYFQYATGPDPYHPDNSLKWNMDPRDNPAPPALRSGTLTQGQRARGNVQFWVSTNPGRLLIGMHDKGETDPLALWLTNAT